MAIVGPGPCALDGSDNAMAADASAAGDVEARQRPGDHARCTLFPEGKLRMGMQVTPYGDQSRLRLLCRIDDRAGDVVDLAHVCPPMAKEGLLF